MSLANSSESDTGRLRLVLAEDNQQLCHLLTDLLGEQFDVVAAVSNGEQALASAQQIRHDILLLDISMPLLNGLAVARNLRDSGFRMPIIFVTEHAEQHFLDQALQVGASGYVLKRHAMQELVGAVLCVAGGHSFVSPSVRSKASAWAATS